MARQALSQGLKNQGNSGGGQSQQGVIQQNQDGGYTPQQKMATALMQPSGGSPYLPASQIGNAALAAYLMPKTNGDQLYQPGAMPTANPRTNRNQDGSAPLGSYY